MQYNTESINRNSDGNCFDLYALTAYSSDVGDQAEHTELDDSPGLRSVLDCIWFAITFVFTIERHPFQRGLALRME